MKKATQILDDSTKSTLFGKFYEDIISKWLEKEESFQIFPGKARIYWNDAGFIENCISVPQFNRVLAEIQEKNKQFCTPDGFVKQNGKYYIWEAKNWPCWESELRDILFSMPSIIATKAFYRKEPYDIHGFLFFWWKEPDEGASLEEEIRHLIEPHDFKIIYMTNILEECIREHYPWYSSIIEKEKNRIDMFFNDLLGNENDVLIQ